MTKELAEPLGDTPCVGESTPEPPDVRLVDRIDPRVVNLLTALGFVLPLAGYFWLLHRYSVNVIVSDQWDDLTVIGHSYTHLFDWSSLWAQHNENRIFFPNLIVILLSRTTHFNVQVEEYLSAIMLATATTLTIWAHKRRSPNTPWLYYCPVAILSLSVVQYENTLWGFQMAWYLVLLALAATIALVDRISLGWLNLGSAIAVAVVGSFSSLQGLLIWPAGLLLLFYRRRRVSFAAAWVAAAMATTVLYFHNFNPNDATPDHNYVFVHPLVSIKFFLFAVGNVMGVHIPFHGPINNAVVGFGLIIFLVAVVTVVAHGRSRSEEGSPIGLALICSGLLFAATVTVGRVTLGYWVASGSRYTTFDLLTLIGIYLTMVGHRTRSADPQPPDVHRGTLGAARLLRVESAGSRWISEPALSIGRLVVAILIVVQIALGLHYGTDGARANYTYQVQAVRVLRNINHSSDGSVEASLYLFKPAPFIRQRARIAQQHHLSVFSNGGFW